ncbi:MAG: acyl-ACP--UDP-N-acetylglucosamine O-acyltransferase [Candidatus Zixiibacteriota bacterium]|nr:MAG: acyl-ACP--UDP-N-acetylglucosamine O-acyltransferase [candidate division Zixibacteria bacterium]
MTSIHPTAIVSSKAQLGSDVTVGPHSIIEDDVRIGDRTRIDSSVLIADGARVGADVRVRHGAVVGSEPQDLKFAGEKSTAVVGDGCILREFVTVNRGTAARGETTLGEKCLLMAYAHAAHDCIIGNGVIMANAVNLGGHVEIGDFAILGGVLPVHQFVKIGAHVMIGGGFRVVQDVCPYSLVAGYPLRVVGINAIGLRRRGFKKEVINTLRKAFKILFFSKLNTSQALTRIKDEVAMIPEVKEILDFINRSDRGIIK